MAVAHENQNRQLCCCKRCVETLNVSNKGGRTLVLLSIVILIPLLSLLSGCRATSSVVPSIAFTRVPVAEEGGPDKLDTIEGKISGVQRGDKLVLFARSGLWWVQPLDTQPFTEIKADTTFSASTHLGTEYAALLVRDGYQPPATTEVLPPVGGNIIAVANATGSTVAKLEDKFINFSGYRWVVRQTPSNRGGETTRYLPGNVFVDDSGALHLRIKGTPGDLTCSEIHLERSLGYGSYIFTVRDIAQLDPSVVFGMFTWDDLGVDQNHREIDIEVSRWGDAASKNAQYVIQPYYVPANVIRFTAPAGRLIHSFHWEPGQSTFRTARGSGDNIVSEHVFSSGIPVPASESVHMNLYYFGVKGREMKSESEVVIEKFEYLP